MSVPYATPQRAGHAPASPSSQQSFAPRSSSIPFSMGHSQSKPVPPLPSSSSPATKGFNAAVAGGIKLKRAFAGRRKKSEDPSLPTVAPRIESSVSAPPQYLNRPTVVSPISLPPTPPKKESPPPELNSVGNRSSVMVISPGISSAVNYISLMDQQKQEADKEKEKENPKENWRKSDSTNSHHTIRPGGGVAKSSRPVSWAESFQSTHTVVQTSNRRLSALIGDADFGMPEAEEDDDDDDDRSDSIAHPPHQRSASQGMPATQSFPLPPSPPPSAPAINFKYPSHSISEGYSIHPVNRRPPPLTSPSASQPPPQDLRGRTLYISPPFSTTASQQERGQAQQQAPPHHPSSAFYSTSPPISSTPSASAAFRQPAISMSSGGIGPAAAGLAKRAVEKMSMGKKWAMGMGISSSNSAASGSGYSSSGSSSHAGSTGGPSSFTSAHSDYGLVNMSSKESMAGAHKHHLHGLGHRRTPGPGSGATSASAAGSISSSSITSSSDASSSDPFAQSSGPMLGRKLRGGLLTKNGAKVAGGVVFGRSLAAGVRETAVFVGQVPGTQVEEPPKEGLVRELEEKMLPAVVVRCAQHILLWGVQEEGLFRVSGRPTHVSKLRAEFDSGADYDMTESTPGDLDPHAVASVFKAYLRELPEPILSHKLLPLFDAAVNKETTINADAFSSGSAGGGGLRLGARPGLPTNGPKSGFAIRKPPSLSTLAMPTFTAIPPPSSALILSIRTLISQLPQENRDLLRTVVELIRATAKRSKETKMPLSNLLLVFCPSLNMTPPLLKVLCEAEGIWGGVDEEGEEQEMEMEMVIDIRRQTMPARSPTSAKDGGGFFSDEPTAYATMEEESESVRSGRASLDTTDNNPSSDYHASAEESIYDDEYEMLGEVVPRRRVRRDANVERREEVPTVYLDCSSSSVSSLGCQEDLAGSEVSEMSMSMPYLQHSREAARDDDGSVSSGNYSMHAPSPPPLLSSSSDSVATPISSGNPSLSHLPLEHEQHQEKERDRISQPQIHAKDHQRHQGSGPEIVEAALLELRPTPQTQTQTQTSKRPVISNPIPIPLPVQFPTSTSPPPQPSTQQQRPGGAAKALKRRSIPMLSLPNFSSGAKREKEKDSPSPSPSPLGSASSGSSGVGPENVKTLTNRSKKPSLKLLFSKRSTSSLTGERDRSNSVGGSSGGGMPFISAPIPQGHAGSMVSLSPEWSPKLQHQHQQGQQTPPPRSAASDSNSSVSTPVSAVTAPQSQQASSMYSLPPVLDTPIEGASFGFDLAGFDMGLTPAPANGSTITPTTTSASASADAPPLNNSRSQQPPVIHPLSMTHRNYIRPQASTSNLSISSTASSHHLSLFDDDDDDDAGMEDWTQSVLLAAAHVEVVQKGP